MTLISYFILCTNILIMIFFYKNIIKVELQLNEKHELYQIDMN